MKHLVALTAAALAAAGLLIGAGIPSEGGRALRPAVAPYEFGSPLPPLQVDVPEEAAAGRLAAVLGAAAEWDEAGGWEAVFGGLVGYRDYDEARGAAFDAAQAAQFYPSVRGDDEYLGVAPKGAAGMHRFPKVAALFTAAMPRPVTLQEAFRGVRAALARAENGGAALLAETIPVYAAACTSLDFPILLQTFARWFDAPVGRVHIVVNSSGQAVFARVVLRAFQLALAAADLPRLNVEAHADHRGLARVWNDMARAAFAGGAPFLTIINADVFAAPGSLAGWARQVHAGRGAAPPLLVSQLQAFAAFALTREAWSVLGDFDEMLWPMYGEDIEYSYRAASLGKQTPQEFATYTERRGGSFHCGSINKKHKAGAMRQFGGEGLRGEAYLTSKWNAVQPYENNFGRVFRWPWNDCRVPHNRSWARDETYLDCLHASLGAEKCMYHRKVLIPFHHNVSCVDVPGQKPPRDWADQLAYIGKIR